MLDNWRPLIKSEDLKKVGFGGGCHWCTEAVFQSLKGVQHVEQGWIASDGENESYSEGVVVYYHKGQIDLAVLVAIHLHTHSCTANHSLRHKYRSAVYTFSAEQADLGRRIISDLQNDFDKLIVTQVLDFVSFKINTEQYQNYYLKNSENQFCEIYINPKLNLLKNRFSRHLNDPILKPS